MFLSCGVKVKSSLVVALRLSLYLMLEFQFLSEVIVEKALVLIAKLAVGVC